MPEDVHLLPHKLARMANAQMEMLALVFELDSLVTIPLANLTSDRLVLKVRYT